MTRKSLYQGPFGELSNYHERLGDTSLPRGENIISSMRRLFQSLDVVAAAAATHRQRFGIGALRRILNVTNTLIFAWLCTIWWGERVVFKNSLDACRWHRWEQWPSSARPHHLALIADPQLVDPHTYPGRPWPLSSLTIFYTDLYLRRSYSYLQQYLQPDTLFFLGDLFDGGREWGTPHSTSPDDQYKRYDNEYWMKEYARFHSIFTDGWLHGGLASPAEPRGRRLIVSLPGNHDLGFASGIQGPVKQRFELYFGSGNRVDVIGNHTFFSVDTVSLSAMDQVDPNTGSSGAGDGTSQSAANHKIWSPTEDFLSKAREEKKRAVNRELRFLAGLREQSYHDPHLTGYSAEVAELSESMTKPQVEDAFSGGAEKLFPSILLSHVPLYRAPGTDCGHRRERGHAIPVQAGYQYQNVLTPLISKDIVSKLGVEEIRQVYSGDDHDYCEIEHGEFTGRIREITVKSMSLAMGVRNPGFQAVSLHNPVDIREATSKDGRDQPEPSVRKDTIQNKLCLLPDQLSIFIRYAMLLILTLIVLGVRAAMKQDSASIAGDTTLLPFSREKSPPSTPPQQQLPFDGNNTHQSLQAISSSSLSSLQQQQQQQQQQTPQDQLTTTICGRTPIPSQRATAPTRPNASPPKLGGYGNLPAASRSSSPRTGKKSKSKSSSSLFLPSFFTPTNRDAKTISSIDQDSGCDGDRQPRSRRTSRSRKSRRRGRRRRSRTSEFIHSTARVAIPVLVFYVWLIRRG